MTRVLVTFGVDGFEELLAIARPGFAAYAERHGYDLCTNPPVTLERAPSWHKIPALIDALEFYDEALWIDSDAVIVNTSDDLAAEIPDTAWQAITRHHTNEGEVPSTGVWFLRQQMQPVLQAMWQLTEHLHHRWWEQAALQELLGYTPTRVPVHLDHETALYRRTHWLDTEWNALALPGVPYDPQARIQHCAPGNPLHRRVETMRELLVEFAPEGSVTT